MDPQIEQVVAAVCKNARYQAISEALVRQVAARELAKGRSVRETIKAVRSKLHQVGGAYQEKPIDYPALLAGLASLPGDPADADLRRYCRQAMQRHASTQEREPFLEDFYAQIFALLGSPHSLLDLACGLNPLALPWMPLPKSAQVYACDIYPEMLAFLAQFAAHAGYRANMQPCDLSAPDINLPAVEAAFLLKTLPCLEQLDKQVPTRLLAAVQARWLVVSFPIFSLGGRGKGMLQFYENHFMQLLAGCPQWQLQQRLLFSNEMVFILTRAN